MTIYEYISMIILSVKLMLDMVTSDLNYSFPPLLAHWPTKLNLCGADSGLIYRLCRLENLA